jgi:hypothetical protein
MTPSTPVPRAANLIIPLLVEARRRPERPHNFDFQEEIMRCHFLSSYAQRLLKLGMLSAFAIFSLIVALPVTAQQDTTPPVLTNFDFSPRQIDTSSAPAEVVVSFHVTDDLSGVQQGYAYFVSPSGQHSISAQTGDRSGDPRDAGYQRLMVVPAFTEPGTWTLAGIGFYDQVSNFVSYDTSQLISMGFPTMLVVTSVQDTSAPVLTNFDFSPRQIDTSSAPAEVVVSFHVTDDLSGVQQGYAYFVSPSGQHSISAQTGDRSGDPRDAGYQRLMVVPAFTEPGTWTLAGIGFYDQVSNFVFYDTSQLISMGFPTMLTNGPSKTSTNVLVNSSTNPAVFNQPVLFTATVSSSAGTPTGTVDFTADGGPSLGTSALDSSGIATISVSSLAAGPHSITATYGGDANYASSSGSLAQTVKQASTSLALTSSLSPSSFNQPVTFTATITRQFGGEATGSVAFYADGSPLGTAPVSGNTAGFETTGLGVGTHSITAIYGGDSNFVSSLRTLTQKVKKATTTTALVPSQNPSFIGQAVTLTATVTPAFGGVPTGAMTFKTGTTVLSAVAVAGGSASYTTDSLPLGSTSITAAYSGDTNFGTSSKSLSQKVNKFATATALNSNLNPSAFGQAITFTATVSSSGPTPSGSVEFRAGTTVLGTRTLAGGTATFTTSALNVGTYSMKAVYSGDGSSAASTSPAVSQKVTKAATNMSLVSSLNPSAIGQSVTFTATVGSSAGTPAGTVTFKAGSKALGTVTLSSGTAAVAASFSTAKPQTITATYSGAANYFGNSATITQMVQ